MAMQQSQWQLKKLLTSSSKKPPQNELSRIVESEGTRDFLLLSNLLDEIDFKDQRPQSHKDASKVG